MSSLSEYNQTYFSDHLSCYSVQTYSVLMPTRKCRFHTFNFVSMIQFDDLPQLFWTSRVLKKFTHHQLWNIQHNCAKVFLFFLFLAVLNVQFVLNFIFLLHFSVEHPEFKRYQETQPSKPGPDLKKLFKCHFLGWNRMIFAHTFTLIL